MYSAVHDMDMNQLHNFALTFVSKVILTSIPSTLYIIAFLIHMYTLLFSSSCEQLFLEILRSVWARLEACYVSVGR